MDLLPFQSKRKITFESGITSIARAFVPPEHFRHYKDFYALTATHSQNPETSYNYIVSAVFLEFSKYLHKHYPSLLSQDITVASKYLNELCTSDLQILPYKCLLIDTQKQTLYTTKTKEEIKTDDLISDIARILSIFTSPTLFRENTKEGIPLWILDSLLIGLTKLEYIYEQNESNTKNTSLLRLLPAPYRKMVEKTLKRKTTLDGLFMQLKSKKKTKKYLRILQKRFGVYHKKKPPFIIEKQNG